MKPLTNYQQESRVEAEKQMHSILHCLAMGMIDGQDAKQAILDIQSNGARFVTYPLKHYLGENADED